MLQYVSEVAEEFGENRVPCTKRFLADRYGALVESFGVVEVALILQHFSEVVEPYGEVRVLCAQGLLVDRTGSLAVAWPCRIFPAVASTSEVVDERGSALATDAVLPEPRRGGQRRRAAPWPRRPAGNWQIVSLLLAERRQSTHQGPAIDGIGWEDFAQQAWDSPPFGRFLGRSQRGFRYLSETL